MLDTLVDLIHVAILFSWCCDGIHSCSLMLDYQRKGSLMNVINQTQNTQKKIVQFQSLFSPLIEAALSQSYWGAITKNNNQLGMNSASATDFFISWLLISPATCGSFLHFPSITPPADFNTLVTVWYWTFDFFKHTSHAIYS